MAEFFAAAQLVGQVTTVVARLRSYWSQVKDVPDDIHHLLREIGALDLILYQIQSDQLQGARPSDAIFGPLALVSLRKSHEMCKDGLDELRRLVNVLAQKIGKKKGWRKTVGCAKVVLKNEEVRRLRKKMKSAVRFLTLAFTYHNR